MHRYTPLRRCLALILTVISVAGVAHAQTETLTLGETVTGSITADAPATWQFLAQDGELVSFYAEADSSDLDPVLRLLDSDGNELLVNDDANPTQGNDALLEAVSLPDAGTYRVVVEAFGETSGAYTLTALPGYSRGAVQVGFNETADEWERVELGTDADDTGSVLLGDAALVLQQTGVDQPIMAVGATVPNDDHYALLRVREIEAVDGWRAGMVFRYSDPQNYYTVQVNHRGAWRFLSVDDGTVRTLQDWALDPSIPVDDRSFDLGVLVNGTGYDIFHDGNYIATITDAEHRTGDVGAVALTTNTVGAEVRVVFDAFVATEPRLASGVLPSRLIAADRASTVRELRRYDIIPAGGEVTLTLPESNVQFNEAGVVWGAVASSRQPRNFVLGTQVFWNPSSAGVTGCGLVVRVDPTDETRYALAYVDSGGGYGMALRQDDRFSNNLFFDSVEIGAPPYEMLVIGVGNEIYYYLNKRYVGTLRTSQLEGSIGEAVINFAPTNTMCFYTNLWLWQITDE